MDVQVEAEAQAQAEAEAQAQTQAQAQAEASLFSNDQVMTLQQQALKKVLDHQVVGS